MSADTPQSPTRRAAVIRGLIVAVVLGLIAAAVLLAQSPGGRSVLRRTHISQPPTAYVQLYFSRPGSLPDYVVATRTRQTVAFVLVNDAHTPLSLAWAIQSRGDSPAARGVVRLGAGRSRVIHRTVPIHCTSHRVYETVRLTHPSESIGYWMRCPSPPSVTAPGSGTTHG